MHTNMIFFCFLYIHPNSQILRQKAGVFLSITEKKKIIIIMKKKFDCVTVSHGQKGRHIRLDLMTHFNPFYIETISYIVRWRYWIFLLHINVLHKENWLKSFSFNYIEVRYERVFITQYLKLGLNLRYHIFRIKFVLY